LGNATTLSSGTSTYVSASGYDELGRLSSRTLGAQADPLRISRSYAYDSLAQQIRYVEARQGSTVLQADTISRDLDDKITSVVDGANQNQVQCFGYDARRQLSSAWPTNRVQCDDSANPNTGFGADGYRQGWTHDRVGNMTSQTTGGTVRSYSYPAAGQSRPHAVTAVQTQGGGTDTYAYHAWGAMTSRTVAGQTSTLTWDVRHRLTSVTKGAVSSSYVYDADAQRLLRRDPDGSGGTTTTLYLEGHELARSQSGAVSATRYYAIGKATVACRGGSTLYWMAGDVQGSVSTMTQAGTTSSRRQRYLPYGGPRGAVNQLWTERGWLGQVEDDVTGLTYLNQRYYDPTLSRFVAADPLVKPGEPQTLDAYSYADNDPATFLDPSGLLRCIDAMCRKTEVPKPPPKKGGGGSSGGGGGSGGAGQSKPKKGGWTSLLFGWGPPRPKSKPKADWWNPGDALATADALTDPAEFYKDALGGHAPEFSARDCTRFVSEVLASGGVAFDYGWDDGDWDHLQVVTGKSTDQQDVTISQHSPNRHNVSWNGFEREAMHDLQEHAQRQEESPIRVEILRVS